MAIKIRKVINQNRVYKDRRLVGTVRKFCCSIDFRIKDKPKGLFSILRVRKYSDPKLIECIDALLSIKIPNKRFHANFTPEIATNKKALKKYQKVLNKSKKH